MSKKMKIFVRVMCAILGVLMVTGGSVALIAMGISGFIGK